MDRNVARVGRAVDPIRARPFDFGNFRHFFGAHRRIGAAPDSAGRAPENIWWGCQQEDVTPGIEHDAPLKTFDREAGDFHRAPGRELTERLGAGIAHVDVAVRSVATPSGSAKGVADSPTCNSFVFAPAQLEPIDDRVAPVDHVDRPAAALVELSTAMPTHSRSNSKLPAGVCIPEKPTGPSPQGSPPCAVHVDHVEVFTALRNKHVSGGFFDRQTGRPFEGTEAVEIGRGRGQCARTRHRQ